MFPQLHQFTDGALLLLRLMIAVVFVSSGARMVKDPPARAKDLGLPVPVTACLGAAEALGGLGGAAGILVQLAAAGLIIINPGAIQKKIFVWHSGFWGEAAAGALIATCRTAPSRTTARSSSASAPSSAEQATD